MKDKPRIGEKAAPAAEWTIEEPSVAPVRPRLPGEQSASGLDPYQSREQLKPRSRKKDLRKLSEWIEAKRKVDALKRQEATAALAKQKSPRKP